MFHKNFSLSFKIFRHKSLFSIFAFFVRSQPRDDLLGTDEVGGPVAAAAHRVEGQVRRALVDPADDSLVESSPGAGDELLARVRVREDADVGAVRNAVRADGHLQEEERSFQSMVP